MPSFIVAPDGIRCVWASEYRLMSLKIILVPLDAYKKTPVRWKMIMSANHEVRDFFTFAV